MTSTRRPKVIVVGAGDRPGVVQQAEQLRAAVSACADIVVWDLTLSRDLAGIAADFVLVLGGDGSILRAAHLMGREQRPVLGVNLGKLGFLAELQPNELLAVLPELCAGRLHVVEHLMLQCTLHREAEQLCSELALNEVAVLAGPPFGMLQAHLYVDAQWVTTYSCDGLILSTPVGSTAHSLSAGGPILRKDLQALVISPLGPHTLTYRPVVDSAGRTYEVRVPGGQPGTVVIDGRVLGPLEPNDRLVVRRAEPTFKMIEVPGHGYYRTLREKLGWSGSLRSADPG